MTIFRFRVRFYPKKKFLSLYSNMAAPNLNGRLHLTGVHHKPPALAVFPKLWATVPHNDYMQMYTQRNIFNIFNNKKRKISQFAKSWQHIFAYCFISQHSKDLYLMQGRSIPPPLPSAVASSILSSEKRPEKREKK